MLPDGQRRRHRQKEEHKICLIIVKPAGIPLPPYKVLDQAFANNDDGMGVAYCHPEDTCVHIVKGAMSTKSMRKLLHNIPNPTEADMIIHFRFATEGAVCPSNCHPFPITSDDAKLSATKIDAKVAVAHNGMIFDSFDDKDEDNWYSKWQGGYYDLGADQSDTQLFIKKYLVGMGGAIFNRKVALLIGAHTSSKFAIMSVRQILTIGDFIKKDGCLYSNTTYKKADPIVTTTYSSYSAYSKPVTTDGDLPIVMWGQQTCDICKVSVFKTYKLVKAELVVCEDCLDYFYKPYKPAELTGGKYATYP